MRAVESPTLVDHLGRPVRVEASSSSRYEGSRFNRLVMDWVVSSFGANPLPWELDTLRDRARDRAGNDPIASSIPNTLVTNIVGPGLQPQSRLREDRLGISETEAEDLQAQAEDIFNEWQKKADAGGRLDFQEIQALVMRSVIKDGEVLINLPLLSDRKGLRRALELIGGERLATPNGLRKANIFQGIELGEERKEPRRYWIRKAPKQIGDLEIPNADFVGIPAQDGNGRPLILHIFATEEIGQFRGVSHFKSVLKYFKSMADSLDAEVVAQKVAACLTAVITQADPSMPVLPTATDASTGKKVLQLEPGIIPTLGIGEGLQMVDFKRNGETFDVFLTKVLRIIGNALGLPYELLLKDFSKTNYSSARAALLEAWRVFLNWRQWLIRKFCQPVWELVLEEAYLRGRFPVQNFYAYREEYCRANWIGPGRGWVDPVKETVAAKLQEDFNYATLADQCAEQGRDWEDVLKQRAREQRRLKELGLPQPMSVQVQIIENGASNTGDM